MTRISLLLWPTPLLWKPGRLTRVHHSFPCHAVVITEVLADYYLHEHLLALWGVPIGELWDLEALSVACAENYQWTFFLSSAPNNVNGKVLPKNISRDY